MKAEGRMIVYVGGFELPDGNAAAQRVVANGRLLQDLGYDVTYVAVGRPATQSQIHGFTRCSRPNSDGAASMFGRLVSIDGVMRAIGRVGPNNVAAVICYNYPSIAMWKLQRRLRAMRIPTVSDCTEWYLSDGKGVASRLLKGLDTALRMRVLNRRCQGIVTISRFLTEYYQGGAYALIELPPLTDCEDGKWVPPRACDTEGTTRLVYMGQPFAARGAAKDRVDAVIEALHRLRSYPFDFSVVGIGQEEYLCRYPGHRGLVEDLGHRLAFHGRVSHPEAVARLGSADFLVFFRDITLATTAGFPTKLAEAVSAGVPVITNRTSCIADYLEGTGLGILADNADAECVARAIRRALALTRSERDAMKEACRTSRRFDYRNYRDRMRAFLTEVARSYS